MRRITAVLAALAILILSGCIQADMLISVEPDGSGTITATYTMATQQYEMMSGMSEGEGDLFNEDELRSGAEQMGAGVTFVSADPIETDTQRGVEAVYAFEDINTVTANIMSSNDMDLDSFENIRFSFTPEDGGTLTIMLPSEPEGEVTPDEVDLDGLGMMKGMMAGMRVSMKVEIEAGIAEVNTRNVDRNVITVMSLDFDEVAADDDNLTEFMEYQKYGSRIAGLAGVTYAENNPIVVRFGAGGGGFPLWYIGIAAAVVLLIGGIVVVVKKK